MKKDNCKKDGSGKNGCKKDGCNCQKNKKGKKK